MKRFCIVLFVLFQTYALFSQEDKQIQVSSLELETDNYTHEWALEQVLNFDMDRVFADEEELASYIIERYHTLVNLRVFESVRFSYGPDTETTKTRFYSVGFGVVSSFPIWGFPFPKYNSNTGFRVGAKLYNDNLAGSLMRLYIGVNIDFKGETALGDLVNQWHFETILSRIQLFDHSFSVRLAHDYMRTSFYESNSYTQNYTNHSTGLDISTEFSLPGIAAYNPRAGFAIDYAFNDNLPGNGSGELPAIKQSYNFSHRLSYGDTNWHGNFREGYSFDLSNGYSFSPAYGNNDNSTGVSVGASYSLFHIFDILNPSFRISGFFNILGDETSIGEYLRGVRDDEIPGTYGAVLNTSLNIKTLRFENFLGGMEIQVQPFLDFGVTGRSGNTDNQANPTGLATGFDMIVYLDAVRSLTIRGTLGINMFDYSWDPFSGSGLSRKYEIDMSSSTFY